MVPANSGSEIAYGNKRYTRKTAVVDVTGRLRSEALDNPFIETDPSRIRFREVRHPIGRVFISVGEDLRVTLFRQEAYGHMKFIRLGMNKLWEEIDER